jgi:hypothetical protein
MREMLVHIGGFGIEMKRQNTRNAE